MFNLAVLSWILFLLYADHVLSTNVTQQNDQIGNDDDYDWSEERGSEESQSTHQTSTVQSFRRCVETCRDETANSSSSLAAADNTTLCLCLDMCFRNSRGGNDSFASFTNRDFGRAKIAVHPLANRLVATKFAFWRDLCSCLDCWKNFTQLNDLMESIVSTGQNLSAGVSPTYHLHAMSLFSNFLCRQQMALGVRQPLTTRSLHINSSTSLVDLSTLMSTSVSEEDARSDPSWLETVFGLSLPSSWVKHAAIGRGLSNPICVSVQTICLARGVSTHRLKQRTHVTHISILPGFNDLTGMSMTQAPPIRVNLQLLEPSREVPNGKKLQCRMLLLNHWRSNGCHMTHVSGSGQVECQCSGPGYLTVFEVNEPVYRSSLTAVKLKQSKTKLSRDWPVAVVSLSSNAKDQTESEKTPANATTTLKPESTKPNAQALETPSYRLKNVTFIIEGDYSVVVGQQRAEFEKFLTIQIAKALNISPDRILNLSVRPGSIIASFQLLIDDMKPGARSHSPSDDPLQLLHQLIDSGQLELIDLHGRQLVVPREALCDSPVTCHPHHDSKSSQLATALVAVGGAAALIVVAAAALTAALKYKKRPRSKPNVTPLSSFTQSTSYKGCQLDQMLEGTSASLEKYRSDPSRIRSPSDIYFNDSLALGDTMLFDGPVPDAAKYRNPSVDQLEANKFNH